MSSYFSASFGAAQYGLHCSNCTVRTALAMKTVQPCCLVVQCYTTMRSVSYKQANHTVHVMCAGHSMFLGCRFFLVAGVDICFVPVYRERHQACPSNMRFFRISSKHRYSRLVQCTLRSRLLYSLYKLYIPTGCPDGW